MADIPDHLLERARRARERLTGDSGSGLGTGTGLAYAGGTAGTGAGRTEAVAAIAPVAAFVAAWWLVFYIFMPIPPSPGAETNINTGINANAETWLRGYRLALLLLFVTVVFTAIRLLVSRFN